MKSTLAFLILCILSPAYADLTNGLVAYYPLDNNANDASGYSRNGIVVGAHSATNRFGQLNRAYFFQNTGEYIVVHDSMHPQGDVSVTYSVWFTWPGSIYSQSLINTASVGSNGLFVANSRSCVGFSGGFIFYSAQGPVNAWFPHGPTNLLGSWHHLVLTKSGTQVTLYLDGVLDGQQSITTGQNVTNKDMFIGYNGDPIEHNGEPFGGKVDDIRIYDRALSYDEVKELYAIEAAPPLSIETAAVRLRWLAPLNVTYQVQWSTDLQSWSNLASVLGRGGETNVVDWTGDGPRKFYRLTVSQ